MLWGSGISMFRGTLCSYFSVTTFISRRSCDFRSTLYSQCNHASNLPNSCISGFPLSVGDTFACLSHTPVSSVYCVSDSHLYFPKRHFTQHSVCSYVEGLKYAISGSAYAHISLISSALNANRKRKASFSLWDWWCESWWLLCSLILVRSKKCRLLHTVHYSSLY